MPRTRTPIETKVLDAADRAIGRYGPVKVTFAAVARQAGLSPALVVRIFGSKHNLLLAVAARASEAAAALFADALDAGGDPLTALGEALVRLAEPVDTREAALNHLALLHFQLADPDLRKHARARERAVRDGIAALLAAAVDAGGLRVGTDCVALARAVQVAHHGGLVAWALAGDGPLDVALRVDVEQAVAPYRSW